MAEAITRDRPLSEPVPFSEVPARGTQAKAADAKQAAAEALRRTRTATEELFQELRVRWEELKQRSEEQAMAAGRSLGRELNQDAKYVRIRARYYHENRPLQTLGVVAAAGFVLGLALGLWRR